MANISVTCPFVIFRVNFDTQIFEDFGLGDRLRGFGDTEADLDFCERLYRSLERELELLLSLDDGRGDLLLLLLRLLLLRLESVVSSAFVVVVVAVGGGGCGATGADVGAAETGAETGAETCAGTGFGTSAEELAVSIFFSGDGERAGLFVFFVMLGLALVDVCLVGLVSDFLDGAVALALAALALAVDDAEEEEDHDEEREEDDEPELLELLADELE